MYTIAVSGAHGKTTTTCMIAELLIYGNMDPTVIVGGLLKKQQDNFVLGQSRYFVVEACEYKESFLNLTPNILVILNIDNDHLDYYGNIENIKTAFKKLIEKVPNDGYIVYNGEDKNIIDILKTCPERSRRIDFSKETADIKLSVPGEHNLKNAKAATTLAKLIGLKEEIALKILKNYTGTWRRFEFMGNTENGALLYNDYGHHPTEIQATLKACKEQYPNHKLIVVFQPHLYSRTKLLLNDFAISFNLADKVIITDIYAAREKDEHKIHAKDLVEVINKNTCLAGSPRCEAGRQAANAQYISSFEEIKKYLIRNTNKSNVILFLGAGDVYKIGEEMKKK